MHGTDMKTVDTASEVYVLKTRVNQFDSLIVNRHLASTHITQYTQENHNILGNPNLIMCLYRNTDNLRRKKKRMRTLQLQVTAR